MMRMCGPNLNISPMISSIGYVHVALSDRQKGLIEECSVVFPDSSHGYCLCHLQENFHKKFKHPDLKNLLWNVV